MLCASKKNFIDVITRESQNKFNVELLTSQLLSQENRNTSIITVEWFCKLYLEAICNFQELTLVDGYKIIR